MVDVAASSSRALKGGGGSGGTSLDFPHASLAFVLCSWIGALIYQLTLRCFRRRRSPRDGDGLFVLAEWSEVVRMIVGFIWMFLICMPAALLTNGWVFGGLIALIEGWGLDDGYYYVIANFLGLFNALTDKNPDTPMGDFLALMLSIFALIVTFTIVGFLTMLQFVVWQSDGVPDTTFGLVRYGLVYIPLGLVLAGSAMGGLVSGVEGWSFKDGFFHMTGTLCAIANPIDDKAISTQMGMFFESYCACLNLGVMAMVITIVTQHPNFFNLVSVFEGKFKTYYESRQDNVMKYLADKMTFEDDEDLQKAKEEADAAISQILSNLSTADYATHDTQEDKDTQADITKSYNYLQSLERECKRLQDTGSRLKSFAQTSPKKGSTLDAVVEIPGSCGVGEACESLPDARQSDVGCTTSNA